MQNSIEWHIHVSSFLGSTFALIQTPLPQLYLFEYTSHNTIENGHIVTFFLQLCHTATITCSELQYLLQRTLLFFFSEWIAVCWNGTIVQTDGGHTVQEQVGVHDGNCQKCRLEALVGMHNIITHVNWDETHCINAPSSNQPHHVWIDQWMTCSNYTNNIASNIGCAIAAVRWKKKLFSPCGTGRLNSDRHSSCIGGGWKKVALAGWAKNHFAQRNICYCRFPRIGYGRTTFSSHNH